MTTSITQISPLVTDGIHKFIRLTALIHSPIHFKWVRMEEDLIAALQTTKDAFITTSDMCKPGKQMYTKQEYRFIEDVKKEMQEFLLEGRTPTESALQRKRNLVMYHLVISPVIDMFSHLSHGDAIAQSASIINNIITEVRNSTIDSHYDDAMVTREQVRAIIQAREAERKPAKKSRKSPTDELLALFA